MLSQTEIKKVEEVISESEKRTDAEFVPVIVKQSDLYPAAHFRLGILFSILIPMVMYYLPWTFYDPIWYLYALLPSLLLGYFLAYNPRLKRLFSTSFELSEEVHQRASEYFLEHGLHATKKRSAILIYISLMEKRIDIIADMNVISAMSTAEKKTLFRERIKQFQKQVKSDSMANALIKLIRDITNELAPHMPRSAGSTNEIMDQLHVGFAKNEIAPENIEAPASTTINSQKEIPRESEDKPSGQ